MESTLQVAVAGRRHHWKIYRNTHVYPSRQYVGNADLVLGFWGSGPLKIWRMWLKKEAAFDTSQPAVIADEEIVAQSYPFSLPFLTGHNVATYNFMHMPVESILRQYKQVKGI